MTDATQEFSNLLIVIPALNEAQHIGPLLVQMLNDAPGAQISVADGGSIDGTREIVRSFGCDHPSVRLVDNPRMIQSVGINEAVALLGDDKAWLVRIDAHCRYPSAYVPRLLNAAARNGAGAVVVPMRSVGTSPFQQAAAAAQNSSLGTGGSPHRGTARSRYVDHGHHALIRLADFRAAGGYCEHLSHNEDAELDIRLSRLGTRIWLEAELAIDYFPRRSAAALFKQYRCYGAGRARTVARHRTPLKTRQALPLGIAPSLALGLMAPLWPVVAIPSLIWAGACLAWGAALPNCSYRARMLTGPAAMIMHAAWSLGFWRQTFAEFSKPADERRPRLRFERA